MSGPAARQPFSGDNNTTGNDTVPKVKVTVSPIKFTDEEALGNTSDTKDALAIWADAKVNNHFERDDHIYMMPLAAAFGFNGGTAAFVQLAAPTVLWIADWTVARANQVPKMPDPDTSDPRWVLMGQHLTPTAVVTGPDGSTPIYRITGTYIYGMKEPSEDFVEDVNYARVPWLSDDFDREISVTDLEEGLIDLIG